MRNPLKAEVEELERFEEILKIIFDQGFGFLLDKLDILHHVPLLKRTLQPKAKKPAPERVRETFEQLGPTFIKFGQIISERPDLVPEEYCKELEKLEDSVPPFDSEKAREIVDGEIGLEKFKEFEDEPIAAASIAQVHEARLRNGDKVAVKVRRPGIQEQMEKDLKILQYMARKADKHFNLGNQMIYREVKEFSRWTKEELDLKKEGRNAERFRENLSDEKRTYIPDIYMEFTTEKVLCMEYVEAVKSNDVEKIDQMDVDKEEVAASGLRSFLKQMLRDGFIHADPHPSNFLVNNNGELVYLDFGMMADIPPEMQKNIGLMILHTYDEDVEGLINTIKKMAYVEDDANLKELEREAESMIMSLRGASLEEESISKVLMNLATTAAENGVYLPTKFVLIGKGLVTMEGIGLKIYPDFEFDEEYQRLVRNLIIKNNADPEELSKSFFIDLVENQDLISKLPSKLNKKLEADDKDQKIVVEQDNQESNLLPASLLLGGLYVLSNSTIPEYRLAIGLSSVLAAGYILSK